MKKLFALFVIAAFAATLAACGKKEVEIREPNTLTVAELADAKRLIPILATDAVSGDIAGWIFPGLTKYDKDIKIVGDIAESWDVSKDGLVITFHLRKNVKWHDGKPFTSADVLFTYKTLKDPKVATPYSDSLGPVGKVEAPDDYTVKVTYKAPFAPALEAWGMGIIPKHLLEGKDINTDKFNRNPVGTGMMKFESWVSGSRITLTANDDYYEGRPHIDRIVARIIPDMATQFLELKARGLDFIDRLTPLQFTRQTDTADIQKHFNKFRFPAFQYTYFGFNLLDDRFKDKRVRKAISYAINQKSIIDGVLLGLGTPCTGPFPPESWAFNKEVKGYAYDPEKAKALLAEAGWQPGPDGILRKDGRPFAFTILTNQGNEERRKSGEIIQQDLKKVGIQVKLETLEWQALLHDFVDKRRFEAVILGWQLSRDPDLYDIWYSTKTKPEEFNFISYSNPEVDRLLIEGRQTFDTEKRKEIYHRIHAIISDDAPCVFLYVPDALPILDKRFKGVKKEPLGIWYNFKDWYVPKNRNEWYQ